MNENPRAKIGDNKPPPSPFEIVKAEIDDLYLEATNFLDGEPISTPSMAGAVEKLEGLIKLAIKRAEEARKAEVAPFDAERDAIQDRYNLLTGQTKSITGTAIRALATCKNALTPYRIKVQAERDAEAARLRAEADEIASIAREAHQAANAAADLLASEEADELLRQSEQAAKAANKAGKASTTKTGLRTTYSGEIVNLSEISRHVWTIDRAFVQASMETWLANEIKVHGKDGGGLEIPGTKIIATQAAT